jgi:hypothetical protein
MPRRNITFSEHQLEKIQQYADDHNTSFAEVVRKALGLMIEDFEPGEVQHGGIRVVHGMKWEYKTIVSSDTHELRGDNIDMLDDGWRLAEQRIVDQLTGNITSVYRRLVDDD